MYQLDSDSQIKNIPDCINERGIHKYNVIDAINGSLSRAAVFLKMKNDLEIYFPSSGYVNIAEGFVRRISSVHGVGSDEYKIYSYGKYCITANSCTDDDLIRFILRYKSFLATLIKQFHKFKDQETVLISGASWGGASSFYFTLPILRAIDDFKLPAKNIHYRFYSPSSSTLLNKEIVEQCYKYAENHKDKTIFFEWFIGEYDYWGRNSTIDRFKKKVDNIHHKCHIYYIDNEQNIPKEKRLIKQFRRRKYHFLSYGQHDRTWDVEEIYDGIDGMKEVDMNNNVYPLMNAFKTFRGMIDGMPSRQDHSLFFTCMLIESIECKNMKTCLINLDEYLDNNSLMYFFRTKQRRTSISLVKDMLAIFSFVEENKNKIPEHEKFKFLQKRLFELFKTSNISDLKYKYVEIYGNIAKERQKHITSEQIKFCKNIARKLLESYTKQRHTNILIKIKYKIISILAVLYYFINNKYGLEEILISNEIEQIYNDMLKIYPNFFNEFEKMVYNISAEGMTIQKLIESEAKVLKVLTEFKN